MRPSLLPSLLACAVLVGAPPVDEPRALSEANTRLAWDLHRTAAGADGNAFLSPLSIGTAMGMATQGARGQTLADLRRVLRQPLPEERQHAATGELAGSLAKRAKADGQELALANALALVGKDLDPAYREAVARDYAAEIFRGDVDAINRWVGDRTRGMIPKLVDQLPAETAAVILNAICFKGTWARGFLAESTRVGDFRLADGRATSVPLMRQEGRFPLAEVGDFRRLTLAYQGNGLAMDLLLPAKGRSLAQAEAGLTAESFAALVAARGKEVRADVVLPRFRLATEYRLKGAFAQLGLASPFSRSSADFTGMGGAKGDLWIDEVIHKAVVEVDEVGTKAAAVTGLVMRTTAFVPEDEPVVFHCDQPFLFVIRSGPTVLFLGRVSDPGK